MKFRILKNNSGKYVVRKYNWWHGWRKFLTRRGCDIEYNTIQEAEDAISARIAEEKRVAAFLKKKPEIVKELKY